MKFSIFFRKFFFLLSIIFFSVFSISSTFADLGGSLSVTRAEVAADFCGPVNVKSSLVLSIVTMCLGGVLEKMNDMRQIKCQTIVCHYESVMNDVDPSFCYRLEEYLTCTFIVGEMFAIPPLSILEYWRSAIANLMANPVGVLWGASAKVARANIKACIGAPCNVWTVGTQAIFLAVTDTLGVVQTIMEMFENGFSGLLGDGPMADACSRVIDIRAEMESILGV